MSTKRMKEHEHYDIGVVIGRFQVAELTSAHIKLLDEVQQKHKQMIIMLGVASTLGTKNDPLPFPVRAAMLRKNYPDSLITHLMNSQCDLEWSKTVDQTIRMLCPFGSVGLYGGRNSFIPHYHGIYSTYELDIINDDEGKNVREEIGYELTNSVDFRKGIIFSCQNQYPRVFQTVDIAITKTMMDFKQYVYLGRRKKGMGLRFPGGFADPSDHSLEMAARREQVEELDLESSPNLVYVGSHLQEDWRYNTPDARIMTVLFQTDYIYGTGRAKEEFFDTEWIEVKTENAGLIEDHHKILFQMLCNHMVGNTSGIITSSVHVDDDDNIFLDEELPVETAKLRLSGTDEEKKPGRVSNRPAETKPENKVEVEDDGIDEVDHPK